MGSRIRCFWLEPADQVEMSLRRFVFSEAGKCPGEWGYHNASVVIGRCASAAVAQRSEDDGALVHGDVFPRNDPRWPKTCSCGYVFQDQDQWQFNPDTLYRRSDNSELVTLRGAPAGAMWDAHWFEDRYRGPDGIHLCVRTPGGEWLVDGPSYNDGKVTSERCWNRSGSAPDFTVSPSILIPNKYHGFLRAGWLEEC